MNTLHRIIRARRWSILSLLLILIIGIYSKLYSGPFANWVNNSLSGMFYEIFWCLAASLFFRGAKPWVIAVCVLSVTCILEFLQLWHNPILELIRNNIIGRSLIGSAFHWSDFPYYVVGCALGWVWIIALRRTEGFQRTIEAQIP